MRGLFRSVLILFLLAASANGCASTRVEDAFSGDLEKKESNEVIAEYCITCHVHKEFDAESHVFDIKYRYEDKRYSGQTECRVCHEYNKTFMLDIRRKTHWPAKK